MTFHVERHLVEEVFVFVPLHVLQCLVLSLDRDTNMFTKTRTKNHKADSSIAAI
jgi:hypothetical protein